MKESIPQALSGARAATHTSTYRYGIAESQQERDELIALRTRVYRDAGKHLDSGAPMFDRWDEDAMLVGVWKDGVPIASARVLSLPPDAEWEHDRFTGWHPNFPQRDDCCEISRFCIDRRQRSWRVTRKLCHAISYGMLRSRRRHFVACSTKELLPFYKRFFNARLLGVSFVHPELGPKEHYLFQSDYRRHLSGSGIQFVPWLLLWPAAVHEGMHMHPWAFANLSALRKGWLRFCVWLEPAAVWAFTKHRREGLR